MGDENPTCRPRFPDDDGGWFSCCISIDEGWPLPRGRFSWFSDGALDAGLALEGSMAFRGERRSAWSSPLRPLRAALRNRLLGFERFAAGGERVGGQAEFG